MATERKAQILSAFVRCIARAGFAGTSLEDVAAEAKLARGHVRHYLGNRHDQVVALCEWVSSAGREAFAEVRKIDDPVARADAITDHLFGAPFFEPDDELGVYLALFEESRRDEELREMFSTGYRDMLSALGDALAEQYPDRPSEETDDLAYLMLCAAVGNAHLSQIGVDRSLANRLGQMCRRALSLLVDAGGRQSQDVAAARSAAASTASTTAS
ncbi:TetR/AcrR family transcriptional regulator [Nocardia rhizosphaerihabitans]|uniref:TetR/AcrR family transcriptional regulator n=1 Tax=Nocardia rhizosphaerihabitans TaxID=1691570 RepID=UPI00366F1D10